MADVPNPLLAPEADTPESLAGSNDLGRVYLAQSRVADENATIERWQRRMAPAPTEGAQPPAGDQQQPGTQPAQAPGGGTLFEQGAAPPRPPGTPAPASGITGRVVRDVGRGITQAPGQIAGGASDAVKAFATSMSHLGDWLNENVADLRIPIDVKALRQALLSQTAGPPIGPWLAGGSDEGLQTFLSDPAKWFGSKIPEVGKSDTVTGSLVRGTAQFLTSLAIGSRVAGAVGVPAGLPTTLAGGAIGDFAGRDPDSGRLADLIDKFPALKNPVSDYLKSDPTDSEAEKRFKNALEGLGLALLTQGMIEAVKYVRKGLIERGGERALQDFAKDPLAAARAQHGEIRDRDWMLLGDPSKPPIIIGETPTGKLIGALKATDTGVPTQVTATGVAGSTADDVARAAQGQQPLRGAAEAPRGAGAPAAAGKEPPIAQFRRTATEIEQTLPPPAEGMTRLWRGNRPGEVGQNPQFTNDLPGIALPFQKSYQGPLSYVDVPTADLGKYVNKGVAAENAEFILPAELAARAKEATVPTGSAGVTAATSPWKPIQDSFQADLKAAVERVEPGVTLDVPTVASNGRFFSVIRGDDGRAIGQFTGTITKDQIRIRQSDLIEAFRGQGRGAQAYAELADRALKSGRQLVSDGEVTEAAAHVYEGLRRRGFTVEQNPAAEWKTLEDGTRRLIAEKGPVFTVTAGPATQAANTAALQTMGEVGKRQVFINFARMNTPEDIRSVIGQTAEAFSGEIKAAARGVQTNELTRQLADDLGLTVEDVLARVRGQPFNAETALAARKVMNTTAEQLIAAAKVASSPNASPADLFAFRKLLAIHQAVQAEVLGARTEAARALQAWSIPAGTGGVEMSRNVRSVMDSMGGAPMAQELAGRLAILSEAGATPAAINSYIRASVYARTRDAIREVWINALLSNPATHLANASSNTLTAIQQVYERKVAEWIASARGAAPGEGVMPGEALAMTYGATQSLNDAWKAAWLSLRHGQRSPMWTGPIEDRVSAVSGQALGISDDGLSRTVDFLGKAVNVPGSFLGAADEFYKTIGYRMELHAQAVRTAASEGLTGQAAAARIQSILLNPPENIRIAAVDQALYQTFTNRTGAFGQGLMNLRQNAPMTSFVMPFVRTPVNISRYAFERSPLAPLVGQWRADIAAGGPRADLAMARIATGTTIMLLAADMADRGVITGGGRYSKDEGEKREALTRQGWQPYSIKIGDKWVSYQRLDPFGMMLGFAADITDVFKRSEIAEEKMDEFSEVMAAGMAAIAATTVDKTYMHGAAEFFAMMSDPKRYSKQWLDRFTGSFVPAGVAAGARAVDPVPREPMTTWEYVQSRLPGLSASLPPKRDLWGQVTEDRSGYGPAFNALSPVRVAQTKQSPIDAEMERLNVGVQRVKMKSDWDGVPVNFRDWPKVYDEYTRLAGGGLEHPAWGIGAKELLDQIVQGKHVMSTIYQMGSDGEEGGKAGFIKRTVSEYRKLARDAIMQDPRFADFAEHINREKAKRQEQRMPVLNQ